MVATLPALIELRDQMMAAHFKTEQALIAMERELARVWPDNATAARMSVIAALDAAGLRREEEYD